MDQKFVGEMASELADDLTRIVAQDVMLTECNCSGR
jgi:hypothetical protein